MWSNDMNCKYMFMFAVKNLARKGLRLLTMMYMSSVHILLRLNMFDSLSSFIDNTKYAFVYFYKCPYDLVGCIRSENI